MIDKKRENAIVSTYDSATKIGYSELYYYKGEYFVKNEDGKDCVNMNYEKELNKW